MVRESITTTDCFSSAAKVPTGVGNLDLPIDAGISRTTCPSILTVNRCASMSATPTTAAPVSNVVFAPPAVTVIGEWAGQNPSGFHCTARSLSQVNEPVGVAGEVNAMVCSAAARSAIGPANVTVTGIATPTTWPGAGLMLATSVGSVTPAEPVATDPAVANTAMPTTTSTLRTALRTVCIPPRWAVSTPFILVRQHRIPG
jgi:hypothetical protein